MDDGHFDLLTVSFADLRSRRGMVRVLATGALAALGLLSVSSGEARKKKKGNKKKPQCQESETLCGNQCVDLDTNPKHCGECDKECDPGQNCLFGDCVDTCSPVCASPEVCCVADCVDLTSTAEHCGQCFKACAENEVCRFANCGCLGPRCKQTGTDATRCCPAANGTCCDNGRCCPANQICVEGGRCCPSGEYLCPGTTLCCPAGTICSGGQCLFPERQAGAQRAARPTAATRSR